MYSKFLESNGLKNYISGVEHNLRGKTMGEKVKDEVDSIFKIMNIIPKEIYSGVQVHGKNIEYCDGENGERFFYGKVFQDTDGLITDKENIALLIKFADCTPIILFDPKKKVQCAIHSGWRGTVKRISQVGIEKMIDEFGCDIEDIIAYLGPSIDMNNYEVGPEVYEAFEGFEDRDKFFEKKGDKYLLSMIDANLSLLLESGISEENIEVSRVSTYEDKNLNSARRDKENYKLNSIITVI